MTPWARRPSRMVLLACVLAAVAATGVVAAAAPVDPAPEASRLPVDPAPPPRPADACPVPAAGYVAVENARPGSPGWDRGLTTDPQMYLDTTTAVCGQAVTVHASGTGPALVRVYRIGDYHGVGARLVDETTVDLRPGTTVTTLATAADGTTRPTASADFPAVARLDVTSAWTPGLYLVRLDGLAGGGQAAWLAVTDPGGPERATLVVSTNTWEAYNSWGGSSAYSEEASYVIDYDRPLLVRRGHDPLVSDVPLVRLLESTGRDTEVVTDETFAGSGSVLAGRAAVILDDHPEYWSQGERDQVVAANRAGAALLDLGANPAYWRIRWETGRRFSIYRTTRRDPLGHDPAQATVRFAELGQPEAGLFGARWGCKLAHGVATAPVGSWLVAGTDALATALAHHSPTVTLPWVLLDGHGEVDAPDPGVTPPDTQALATARLSRCNGGSRASTWQVSWRPADASHGAVLDAGAEEWEWALDPAGAGTAHADVVRMTLNVLDRVLGPAGTG